VDSSINRDNLDIDSVIANVKQEFKNFLIKREQLVIKLGKALENEHQNKKENICAEIKGILRQEVADGLISRRDIERYSLDEWKKNTKPKKEENDNLSFSTQVKEAIPRVLVDAYGNSEIEPVAISTTDPNNNVVIYDGQPQDVEDLNTDSSPIDEDLEQAIKKSTSFTTADQQLSEQSTVVELKTEIERLQSNLQSKSDENSALHIRIKELEARPQAIKKIDPLMSNFNIYSILCNNIWRYCLRNISNMFHSLRKLILSLKKFLMFKFTKKIVSLNR
jgi:hypothetical protein